MSVVVSGPRRLYVVLLFWQRLTEPCSACPRSVSRAASALGAREAPATAGPCNPVCRVVVRLGLQRVLWRRLIGFSVFVLDPRRSAGKAPEEGVEIR
jgi:hypothetical protein